MSTFETFSWTAMDPAKEVVYFQYFKQRGLVDSVNIQEQKM